MKKISIKTFYLIAVISIGLIGLAVGSTYAMFTTSAEINNPITISSNLISNDDVMETFMMNLLYNGSVKAMMPKLYSDNVEGLELIRPLYMVRERAIINWMNHNELQFLRCACKLTQAIARGDDELTSKRYETKQLIKELAKIDKNVEKNIFQAASNVVLDKIIEYKSNSSINLSNCF